MHPLQLDGHVPELMNNASLHLEKGVYLPQCLQRSGVTVRGDELQDRA